MWTRHDRLLIALAALALTACGDATGSEPPGGLASCTSAPILTVPPAALSGITNIVPLGNLNPGGHTFPTDHVYFIVPRAAGSGDPVVTAVVAPGDIRLASVASSTNTQNGVTRTDYSLYFYGCSDVQFYFHHIQVLSPGLTASIGKIEDGCSTYSTGGGSYKRCYKELNVALRAGDAIGTAGGPGLFGFDLGAIDRRIPKLGFVNQSFPDFGGNDWNTFHTACPLDYFAPAVKASLEAKLGNGMVTRTAPPVCGTIMQDVAGTAQGRWFKGTSELEDPHLALVHDNVDPRIGTISMGTSVPSIPVGAYKFAPASSASSASSGVNTDFSAVTADGRIRCYEGFTQLGGSIHVLLRLPTSTSLEIEGVAGSSCGPASTWSFTAGAVTFAR